MEDFNKKLKGMYMAILLFFALPYAFIYALAKTGELLNQNAWIIPGIAIVVLLIAACQVLRWWFNRYREW